MNRDIFLKGDRKKFLNGLNQKEIEHMHSIRYIDVKDTKIIIDNIECSNLLITATWSGTITEVSRKLEFSLIKNDAYYSPKVDLSLHKLVQFFVNSKEIFRGYIFDVSTTAQGNEIVIAAYDGGIFLLKSRSFCKFKNMTPEEVTKKVCKEVGVEVNHLEKGKPYTRIHDGDSIYEIIMTGYSLDSLQTGKQYYTLMEKGQLNVLKKGEVIYKYHLNSSNDIFDTSYHISGEEVINKVKAYDEEGNYQATFTLDNMVSYAGIMQAIYKGNDLNEAKKLLKKPKLEASIEGFGELSCITGKAVNIHEEILDLKGLYYINADTHTFENGLHKMNLSLSLENVMPIQVAGSDKEDENTQVGDKGSRKKLMWPVPSTRTITQGFGGFDGKHRGIDIGGSHGSVIVASADGVIVHAGHGEDVTYGNSITIKHSNSLFTRYAHLSQVSVKKGQMVTQGQKIGNVGNTGRSFGAHLHFEVLRGGVWGKLENPMKYFK